ncbi:MAG: AmmeMemoRadiSam system protein B [Deltaproteobacteria bacterium]|nr:AmmeMemoRadiSam system protein B [Deltaproteobacteria bacterium]MBI3296316.1 AmmeMemoRadiSam system protein B [Deltaproteobacteria bacterium]
MPSQDWTRASYVAGRFYPDDRAKLERTLSDLMPNKPEGPAIALMAPHAGYIYSGRTAGLAYSETIITPTVFVLCPNHTGKGARVSVWSKGEWNTPLGSVSINTEIAGDLLKRVGTPDRQAHLREHAIEVHVPFLQMKRPDVKIVPIVLGGLSLDECHEVASEIAHVADGNLIVASTDMSHFISRAEAREKDTLALDAVEKLDPDRLYNTVCELDISMCGFLPTTVTLLAAKKVGAKEARIIDYSDSGDETGDLTSVVGYASAIIS